jgi:hypothetical protein
VYWWNSTEDFPESITEKQVLLQLNTDFSIKGMTAQDLQAIVAAWQSGAISQDTMFELFRRGEILPDGRSNEDEASLIGKMRKLQNPNSNGQGSPNLETDNHA